MNFHIAHVCIRFGKNVFFFFAVSLAQDWLIHLKLMLFSLGSNGRKVVCNSSMENTYLKLRFNPPKPLQSKPGEKAANASDFVENWRWRTIFSYAYNILGATKLLIIECRLGGDYLQLCPVRVTKSSLEVVLALFTSTLSIYSQGYCFCLLSQTCISIFISLPSARSIPLISALFSSRL